MPVVQELTAQQIEDCLDEAIRRQTPAALTWRDDSTWHNLHTRILQRRGKGLWLAQPVEDSGQACLPPEGMLLGLSFKLRHHKHVSTTSAQAVCRLKLDGGPSVQALRVAVPERMQRIQRRAFLRVEVPPSRSVLATLWQGGSSAPDGNPPGITWQAWVSNLSAGGFQVRMSAQSAPVLEEGDLIAVRIELGQEFPPLEAEAQFRHASFDARGVALLGFQFVGLSDSAHWHETLDLISRVVRQFQNLQDHRADRTVA